MDFMGVTVLVVLLLGACYVALLVAKKRMEIKKETKQRAKELANLEVSKGLRYTTESNTVSDEGDVNITHKRNDILLAQNAEVVASVSGEVKPGKYIMLSTNEQEQTFNVRVGLFVKEYKHNQEIVLAEGDRVCPVSGSIILR